MIIKRRECKDCKQEQEYFACAFKESMSHWREPEFIDRSFSHVMKSGRIDGILTTLKVEAIIAVVVAICIVISRL